MIGSCFWWPLIFFALVVHQNNYFFILRIGRSNGSNTCFGGTKDIWWKPIFPCKLWKFQFGPSDQHPKGGAQRGGRGDLQKCDYTIQGRVQIVKLPNPPYPLDVDPITQIEVSIVCTERLVCTWYVPYSNRCINHMPSREIQCVIIIFWLKYVIFFI